MPLSSEMTSKALLNSPADSAFTAAGFCSAADGCRLGSDSSALEATGVLEGIGLAKLALGVFGLTGGGLSS